MTDEITPIIFFAFVLLISPILLWAIWAWVRLFVSAWVVLWLRLLGRNDKTKEFSDEIGDMAFPNTEYRKMKREFDEKAEKVSASLEARRTKPL